MPGLIYFNQAAAFQKRRAEDKKQEAARR